MEGRALTSLTLRAAFTSTCPEGGAGRALILHTPHPAHSRVEGLWKDLHAPCYYLENYTLSRPRHLTPMILHMAFLLVTTIKASFYTGHASSLEGEPPRLSPAAHLMLCLLQDHTRCCHAAPRLLPTFGYDAALV